MTPNRQAARYLRVPYRSLESLARRRLELSGQFPADPLTVKRLLLRSALDAGEKADPAGLAAAAEATVRELLRAGVETEVLASDPNPRVSLLGRLTHRYLALLDRDGLVDPGQLLWRASETGGDAWQLHVSGYPRLPLAECAFLDSIAAAGSVLHLPLSDSSLLVDNRRSVEWLEMRGWQVEEFRSPGTRLGERLALSWIGGDSGDRQTDNPAVSCHAYPDEEAESRGTLAQVKQLLSSGVPARDIAIVARHEASYGPRLLAIADEYGVPLRALYDVPFSATRVGSWLELLLEVVRDDFPFETTSRLLASGLVRELPPGFMRKAREERFRGADWAPVLPPSLVNWPEEASLRSHVDNLMRVAAELGLRDGAIRWSREALAFGSFTQALTRLSDASLVCDFEGFAGELRQLMASLTCPAQPGRGGVELHSPLSLFGASVPHLFIVGATEGMLPMPVRSDPRLDPFEREGLRRKGQAIEVVAEAARREELSFWALLQSVSERLVLSLPRLAGGRETLPSPFLARLGLVPTPPPELPACSRVELRRAALLAPVDTAESRDDPVWRAAGRARAIESRRESDQPHDIFDGVTGVPYHPPLAGVGVSRLVDLASCPFKFFASRVLRLTEVPEGREELDALDRGNLYHEVLQRAFELAQAAEPEAAGDRLRAEVLERLPEALAGCEESTGLTRLADWHLQRESHLIALRRAVQAPDFLTGDARVVALERSFEGEWRGIRVRGKVDRVDETSAGVVLVDYKSGGRVTQLAKDESGQPLVDLQLPIYREAAAPVLTPELPVAGTRYFSISKAEEIRVAAASDAELDRISAGVTAAWEEGSFPVDPDVRYQSCGYCDFESLCRKGNRPERKRAGE